jgi:hypothetical protein
MKDTIEMLEAIGSDASLRHASMEHLTKVLEETQATEALTLAVASGDSSPLAVEFGHKEMHMPQISQVPGFEEDEEPMPGNDDSQPADVDGEDSPSL